MTLKGIAFDLEGTLVDVERAHHEGHVAAAAEVLGLTLTVDEAVERFPHFVGGTDTAIAEEMWLHALYKFAGSGAPPRATEGDVLASMRRHYEANLKATEIALRPGANAFMAVALHEGLTMAIGSLTPTEQAEGLLRAIGSGGIIRGRVVLAEDVVRPKPAADVYLETARRMGVTPAEQLVFEDSTNGVRAAVAAGSLAVGMPTRPEIAGRLLAAGACRVFHDWREINPSALIANLGALG